MSRALTSLFVAAALLAGCSVPRSTIAPRADGGAADAPSRSDASTPPIALGPVVAGPALDGVDRARDPACPASARWAVGVVGRVLDEHGAPRSGVLGQSCLLIEGGRNLCLAPEPTNDDGVFTIPLAASLRCIHEVALRVIDPRATVSAAYASAPSEPDDGVLFASRDLVLYDLLPATTLPSIGDASAARAIAFPGAELTIAPAMLDEGAYESLAARVLTGDAAASASFLGNGEPFVLVATFGPESRVDGSALASFRLTDTGLTPGTHASLFALSGLYTTLPDGTLAREGRWLPLADVTVDADGAISTPHGVGLTGLGWVGVTIAP